jgi:hypothetical protein
MRKCSADCCTELCGAFGSRQPIKPFHERVMKRCWQKCICFCTSLQHRFRQFLKEQWHAVGLRDNPLA